ncbi:MAG: arginyl-tRNA synthetase [Alteromonas naphthalenivorans]|jgi:arginyl-tRNA synthetase
MNTIQTLEQKFFTFLGTLGVKELPNIDFKLNADDQKQKFGDISSNAALMLAKKLGVNPRHLAEEIINRFPDDAIKKIDIAGPGFLNIFLTEDAFKTIAKELFTEKDHYFEHESPHGIFNLEFVSANPTGPLHLGHGRGGIIGDVLGNILKFLGYKITKEHYVNDAGAQMVKLGNSLKIRCQQETGQTIEMPEQAYHGDYLKDMAKECVTEHGKDVLEKSEQFFIDYAYAKQFEQLKKTTHAYGIDFDVWFSERTLHPEGIEQAIERLDKAGKTYTKDGALWFKATDYGDDKDRVLKKADGTYTYAAADAAYMLDKFNRGFTTVVIVLGQDHDSYPKRLNGIRQALGLHDLNLDCIIYQLVSMKKDGESVRMSKRAGAIINLQDVVDQVGTDVARFFYLNRKADAHLDFDLDLALKKDDENPVYYLQYAYVRTNAIITKAKDIKGLEDINVFDAKHLTETENLLIKKMAALQELLEDISKNYQVHLLTYYLLELAHLFHNYYHHNRVIEPKDINQSRARLFLTILVQDTFERCLTLMGVSKPERM